LCVQQTVESGSRISQRDVVDAVFDLPAIAIILPLDTGRLIAALGCSRFVNAADRLGACMLDGDDPNELSISGASKVIDTLKAEPNGKGGRR
jgi:hypothetical protein